MKTTKNYLYLPENLELEKLLDDKKKNKFFFHYAYIISTIYLARFKSKNITKDDYVNLNIDTLRLIISKEKCKSLLDDLIRLKVIECDRKRVYGVKSFGYKFPVGTPGYENTFRKIELEDKLIIKKMNNFRERQLQRAIEEGADYEHLCVNLQKIKINYKKAYDYISANYTPFTDDYDARIRAVDLIDSRDLFFVIDKKAKRAHTNLTNLASDLRQFVTVDGRKLGQVDLSNSQPFFLNLVLRKRINIKNASELEEFYRYKEITEKGQFYEYLMGEFGIENDNPEARMNFKKMFFGRVFFDVNRTKLKKEEELFQKLFPTIFRIIREIKQEDYTQLAISLQKAESEAIITKCIRRIRIEEPEMFVSTIHDSIVGELNSLEYFKIVLEDVFELEYNLKPGIKTEKF